MGYGDRYPVLCGTYAAIFIMFMGVGIIGVLASILASLLVADRSAEEAEAEAAASHASRSKKAQGRQEELALMRHAAEMSAGERARTGTEPIYRARWMDL